MVECDGVRVVGEHLDRDTDQVPSSSTIGARITVVPTFLPRRAPKDAGPLKPLISAKVRSNTDIPNYPVWGVRDANPYEGAHRLTQP